MDMRDIKYIQCYDEDGKLVLVSITYEKDKITLTPALEMKI